MKWGQKGLSILYEISLRPFCIDFILMNIIKCKVCLSVSAYICVFLERPLVDLVKRLSEAKRRNFLAKLCCIAAFYMTNQNTKLKNKNNYLHFLFPVVFTFCYLILFVIPLSYSLLCYCFFFHKSYNLTYLTSTKLYIFQN